MSSVSELHVVFGAGPLGRATANALLRRGRRVRIVNRSGRMLEAPAGAELAAGDAYQVANVRELTAGAAAAYQCAQPPYHEWPEKFPPLQAAILAGAAQSGAKLIIADNLYAYGDTGGRPLTEALPYTRAGRKPKTRAAMAEAALAAHRAGQVRVALGRGSDFFGPYVLESAMGERVFYPALAGRAAQVGGRLDRPHTLTFIEDFGEGLAVLGEHEAALGRAWHVANDQPQITQRQFLDLIGQALGRPVTASVIGRPLMALAGLFIPGARETVEMLYEFEQPFVVDSQSFETTFGVKATPLAEAVRRTLAWYQAHPQSARAGQPAMHGAAA